MKESDNAIEALYRENLKLKVRLEGVRGELKGYRSAAPGIATTNRQIFERMEQLTGEVERLRATCDALGAAWKYGGTIDVNFDILAESLGPTKSLELVEIIQEKFGNLEIMRKRA